MPTREKTPGPEGDEGSTMLELVIALSVLALVFTFSLMTTSGTARTDLANRRADAAQRLVSQAAERAAVFDCGILPVADGAAALTTALTRQQTRCEGSLGTRRWTTTEVGMTFNLRLDVQWIAVNANTVLASTTTVATSPCPSYRLRRTVTASWFENGATRTRTTSVLAVQPVDSVARLRTGLVEVNGTSGDVTSLRLAGFDYPVTFDTGGKAVLPFLEAGTTYTLRNPDTLAEVTASVPAASGEACRRRVVTAP